MQRTRRSKMPNAPLISFVVPLRPSVVPSDWATISRLCCQTLNSCLQSGGACVHVILVATDMPLGLDMIKDDRLEVITVPSSVSNMTELVTEGMEDKWRKVRRGFERVSELSSMFVMIVDADDLVSRKLITHLESDPPRYGFIFKSGYSHLDGSRWIVRVDNTFNCGTNAVLRSSEINLLNTADSADLKDCIALNSGHTTIEKTMMEIGRPLDVLPFRGSVYVQHRFQHSKRIYGTSWRKYIKDYIKKIRKISILNRYIREEFGIYS